MLPPAASEKSMLLDNYRVESEVEPQVTQGFLQRNGEGQVINPVWKLGWVVATAALVVAAWNRPDAATRSSCLGGNITKSFGFDSKIARISSFQ